jgi:hypothetical protein
MFVIEEPKLSLLVKVGPFVVELLISTVESTSPAAANASGGNWKRSEHVANNKMNK